MTFLAGLGGTSYSGPLSLQLFAQQPYDETPYKYVEHVKASNCLKQHRQRVTLRGSEPYLLYKYLSILICITHLFSSMFIIVHPYSSGIPLCNWSPFLENAISLDQRCNRLFKASNLFTLSCPNPRTIKGRWGWVMVVIDEIKKSKNQLAFHQTLVPTCSLSRMKDGKHVMCRLVDNRNSYHCFQNLKHITSKHQFRHQLSIIKHQTLNCSPRSSRSDAWFKSLKAFTTLPNWEIHGARRHVLRKAPWLDDDCNYDLRCKCLSSALTWSISASRRQRPKLDSDRRAFCCRRLKPTLQVAASRQKKAHLQQITNIKAQAGTGRTNTGGRGRHFTHKVNGILGTKDPNPTRIPNIPVSPCISKRYIQFAVKILRFSACHDFLTWGPRTSGRVRERDVRHRPRMPPSSSSSLRDGCIRFCP